ncbi:GNAT family N-acetyltransferase [Nocardioides sp. BP30]|uniref:GNAT family N-acetyltransferase n=1 Tax=Nocardioides sp. BP30 TaxID=3036374 RepID=UPI0024686E39|nr:GNAT family N-acetyltransferase [Nocardioides sp. BP30]WGL53417.1 GNAT family N-acetyltransferase [Nocardioides sp. BP30]
MTASEVVTVLRRATSDDVPMLLALWEVAAENDSRPTDTAEKIEALLGRDPDACTVAERDGRLVGSLIAGWDGWRAHLYRLAVHPDVRRQGVGRLLLADAEERFRALGAGRIDAMVLEGNDLGQSLWRSAGYTPQPQWRRWVKSLG